MWETWIDQWEAAAGRTSYESALKLAQLALGTGQAINRLALQALNETIETQVELTNAISRADDAETCSACFAAAIQKVVSCNTGLNHDVGEQWQVFQAGAQEILEEEQLLLGQGPGIPAFSTERSGATNEDILMLSLNAWLAAVVKGFAQMGLLRFDARNKY